MDQLIVTFKLVLEFFNLKKNSANNRDINVEQIRSEIEIILSIDFLLLLIFPLYPLVIKQLKSFILII